MRIENTPAKNDGTFVSPDEGTVKAWEALVEQGRLADVTEQDEVVDDETKVKFDLENIKAERLLRQQEAKDESKG